MSFINDFLSLIYPRRCEACESVLYRHEHFICINCRLSLPQSNYHLSVDNELQKVFYGRVPVIGTWPYYLFEKSGRVQRLLHAIKYQDQKELAMYIGSMYGKELRQKGLTENIDVIIPIPLHTKKLKSRGYNQSEWFGRGLSESIAKPLDPGYLERTSFTSTQTRKNKYQRWENVEGIFNCKRSEELKYKHILLVDDVVTTGATIEAAHLAFKKIEGLKLSLASIAFAAKLR